MSGPNNTTDESAKSTAISSATVSVVVDPDKPHHNVEVRSRFLPSLHYLCTLLIVFDSGYCQHLCVIFCDF